MADLEGHAPRLLSGLLDAGTEDDAALVSEGVELSYGELRERVERLAGHLAERAVEPGDRVLVALTNGVAFATGLLATWRAGAVPVPVDARIPAGQALGIAADCGARALLCEGDAWSELAPRFGEAPDLVLAVVDRPPSPRIVPAIDVLPLEEALESPAGTRAPAEATGAAEPDDFALLAYTSGSTGRPKGVMHGHRSLLASLEFTVAHEGIGRADRVLIGIPMHHLFALRVLLAHLMAGATVIAERDLLAGLRRIDDSQPSSMILVPAAVRLLVDRFATVLVRLATRVRRVAIGSAPIAEDTLTAFQRLLTGAEVLLPYGMTEARIGFLEPRADRDGRPTGRAIVAVDPRLELRVLDEEGADVTSGLGEVVLRGEALMLGYWHDTPEERARMRAEGFCTRDLVEVTETGERLLVGRIDDVISVGGEKVFPAEVESALRAHAAVRDALASGVDDPRGLLGQVVRADVLLEPGASFDPEELLEHCRARLEPYKVPALLEQASELVRRPRGRLVRMPARDEPGNGSRGTT